MTKTTPIHATEASLRGLADAPLMFKLAARAALRLQKGSLLAVLPDGRELLFDAPEEGPHAEIILNDWRFTRRMIAGGALGVAESYIDGDWDTPDLAAMLGIWSLNMDAVLGDLDGNFVVRFAHNLYHRLRPNTRTGAQKNIYAHYDLGNDFFQAWLDPSMTYSSALFDDDTIALEKAQNAKYSALCDAIGVSDGDHILEIGCGWGGFAEFAAKERGARVSAVTISREQHEFAQRRIAEGQLSHKVDIALKDYRDIEGQYDGIASIEMFEAVGQRYWPTFFDKVSQSLKPGRRAGLQIITIKDELFDGYRNQIDFIQRYIFPGGMLPSDAHLREHTERAGLQWRGVKLFGQDYAETLAQWRRKFETRWDDICAMNPRFDEPFRRLWRYYLAYCEAGFRTERIDVGQFTLAKA